jgi:hypothetical protein
VRLQQVSVVRIATVYDWIDKPGYTAAYSYAPYVARQEGSIKVREPETKDPVLANGPGLAKEPCNPDSRFPIRAIRLGVIKGGAFELVAEISLKQLDSACGMAGNQQLAASHDSGSGFPSSFALLMRLEEQTHGSRCYPIIEVLARQLEHWCKWNVLSASGSGTRTRTTLSFIGNGQPMFGAGGRERRWQ